MLNKRITKIMFLSLMLVICSAIGIYMIKHEIEQEARIRSLQAEINLMKNQSAYQKKYNYSEGTYNYLAIGNSITWHGVCDYWWAQRGMAASTTEKDYYHIVLSHLKSINGSVTSYVTNLNIWENLSEDRAETLIALDPYLDSQLDLVTIQLGENVKSLTTFETDFQYLVTYIKNIAPNAQVIIVGDFWEYPGRDVIKATVANNTKCEFVDLKEIKEKDKYLCSENSIVYDDSGKEYVVKHKGVTKHPNDLAMAYIAEKVIQKIE